MRIEDEVLDPECRKPFCGAGLRESIIFNIAKELAVVATEPEVVGYNKPAVLHGSCFFGDDMPFTIFNHVPAVCPSRQYSDTPVKCQRREDLVPKEILRMAVRWRVWR